MNGLPMKAIQETPGRQPARANQERQQNQGTQDLAEKETTGLFTQLLIQASTLIMSCYHLPKNVSWLSTFHNVFRTECA